MGLRKPFGSKNRVAFQCIADKIMGKQLGSVLPVFNKKTSLAKNFQIIFLRGGGHHPCYKSFVPQVKIVSCMRGCLFKCTKSKNKFLLNID